MLLAFEGFSFLQYQPHNWGRSDGGFGRLTVTSCHRFLPWKLQSAQRKICCGNTRVDEPEAKKPRAVKEANASPSFHQYLTLADESPVKLLIVVLKIHVAATQLKRVVHTASRFLLSPVN